MSARQRVWRGLPNSAAARREPKLRTPATVPLVWDPAGDKPAQDAALRAASRVSVAEAAAAQKESARQSTLVVEEARQQKAAAARATSERAEKAAAKAAFERADRDRAHSARSGSSKAKFDADRAQPLALARASLAASEERCRRVSSQPKPIEDVHRFLSETKAVAMQKPAKEAPVALAVDENDTANAHPDARHRCCEPKVGGLSRTRPSSGRLKKESGGDAAELLRMPSGRSLSLTRWQSSHSLGSIDRSSGTPWLGIGFDGANADPWGRDEAIAHQEPPAGLDGDTRHGQLQAELERVRHLEALLQSEKAKSDAIALS